MTRALALFALFSVAAPVASPAAPETVRVTRSARRPTRRRRRTTRGDDPTDDAPARSPVCQRLGLWVNPAVCEPVADLGRSALHG